MLKFIIFCISFCGIIQADQPKVLVFSGSTREDSLNKKFAKEAANIAARLGADVLYVDLRDLPMPFYDGDVESKGMPANAGKLRNMMIDSNVIVIASPEYNASVSAVLKNAIDWASRTENAHPSRQAFKGKTFVLMSASPGGGGGARGLNHLQTVIEDVGGKGVIYPRKIILPNAYDAFDNEGKLINLQKLSELQSVLQEVIGSKQN